MSVRQGLLALLAQEAMYGARLRSEFEARTGSTWPLNVGQVYTTLARLERDGLVVASDEVDEDGRTRYALTDSGRAESTRWWFTPVSREASPRDELVIKLALAVTLPDVDVARVVQTQRTATLRHLRDLTRLKSRMTADETGGEGGSGTELAWSLVLENELFAAEAEARWLDHVEARLAMGGWRHPTGRAGAAEAAPSTTLSTTLPTTLSTTSAPTPDRSSS